MCLMPDINIPKPQATPRTPQPDSFAANMAADEARRLAAGRGGSSANLISDLTAGQITSARPVINPQRAVMLGQ